MDALLPAIGVAVFALVAYVILRLVAAERERKAEGARQAAALGFRLVEADDAVVARIVALHRRHAGQALDVRNLHRREAGGHTLHLFDLADTSSDQSGPQCDRAIAIVSPALRLPRFTLIPRIELEGKLAALGNWLLAQVGSPPGRRLEFTSPPAFAQRYTLIAKDEAAARRFFTTDRLARLAETRHWMLQGEDDLLTVDRLELDPSRGRRVEPSLGDRVRDAERALEILAAEERG